MRKNIGKILVCALLMITFILFISKEPIYATQDIPELNPYKTYKLRVIDRFVTRDKKVKSETVRIEYDAFENEGYLFYPLEQLPEDYYYIYEREGYGYIFFKDGIVTKNTDIIFEYVYSPEGDPNNFVVSVYDVYLTGDEEEERVERVYAQRYDYMEEYCYEALEPKPSSGYKLVSDKVVKGRCMGITVVCFIYERAEKPRPFNVSDYMATVKAATERKSLLQYDNTLSLFHILWTDGLLQETLENENVTTDEVTTKNKSVTEALLDNIVNKAKKVLKTQIKKRKTHR